MKQDDNSERKTIAEQLRELIPLDPAQRDARLRGLIHHTDACNALKRIRDCVEEGGDVSTQDAYLLGEYISWYCVWDNLTDSGEVLSCLRENYNAIEVINREMLAVGGDCWDAFKEGIGSWKSLEDICTQNELIDQSTSIPSPIALCCWLVEHHQSYETVVHVRFPRRR